MKRTIPLLFAFALSPGMAVAETDTPAGPTSGGASGGYESDIERDSPVSGSHLSLPSFVQADQDSSGAIEREEVTAIPGIDFSSADLDANGRLSQREYEAVTKGVQQPMDSGRSTAPGGASESSSGTLNR
jgi:hypothetical protein